jgi:putative FmdB family regulatory protein
MPLYEYQCDACGHRFEHIQKFSDPLLTVCPQCDGALHKLVSSPAFQFKGTGWYVTDYAKKDRGAEAEKSSDGKETTSDTKSTSDKTDTADKTKSGGSTSSSDSSKSDSSKKTSTASTSGSS